MLLCMKCLVVKDNNERQKYYLFDIVRQLERIGMWSAMNTSPWSIGKFCQGGVVRYRGVRPDMWPKLVIVFEIAGISIFSVS